MDLGSLPRIRMVPLKSTLSITDQQAPMESISMSRHHYQPYERTASHRRYGEPIPNFYVPPLNKFEGTTTSGDTFKWRRGKVLC